MLRDVVSTMHLLSLSIESRKVWATSGGWPNVATAVNNALGFDATNRVVV